MFLTGTQQYSLMPPKLHQMKNRSVKGKQKTPHCSALTPISSIQTPSPIQVFRRRQSSLHRTQGSNFFPFRCGALTQLFTVSPFAQMIEYQFF